MTDGFMAFGYVFATLLGVSFVYWILHVLPAIQEMNRADAYSRMQLVAATQDSRRERVHAKESRMSATIAAAIVGPMVWHGVQR